MAWLIPSYRLVVRKDVLEEKNWRNGFAPGFPDKEKKWAYATTLYRTRFLWVNTEMVKEGEIKTIKDLLDPKWKGKICSGDPRTIATGSYPASNMRKVLGDDVIKRLWKDQEVILFRDFSRSVEAMVRGQFAIGIGAIDEGIIKDFQSKGVGKNLKPVDLDDFDTVLYGDVLWYLNRAPHPNAAKLFINWMLTKEGQTAYTKWSQTNSRRVDVPPVNPELEPLAGRRYGDFQGDGLDFDLQTREMASKILA